MGQEPGDKALRILDMLKRSKEEVDRVLFAYLPQEHPLPEVAHLYTMMRDYPSRASKGLRPFLLTLTCQALGGDGNLCLTTGAAIELFQNWVLIHDDIEDASERRRGDLVLHLKYSVPLAINAGDALHAKMWEVVLDNQRILGAEKTLKILREFLRMVKETTEGQHIELRWVEEDRWDLEEEDYYAMVTKKTSWYTCITPMRLGAIIADKDAKMLEELVGLGRDLGIAFQIRDDILNMVGEEEKYGKERGGDIYEGKRTLLLVRLMKVCKELDRRRVMEIMKKPRIEKRWEEVQEVLRMMESYGVVEYANKKALEFATKAKDCFRKAFSDAPGEEAKAALEELIDYMVLREW